MKLWVNKTMYGYSTFIKNEYNEEKITMFMDVQFKKEIEPQNINSIFIKVTDSFFSCYKTSFGEIKPKLIIMEYEIIDSNNNTTSTETEEDIQLDLTDDFLD